MDRESAIKNYNKIVDENILLLKNNDENYLDPDEKSGYYCLIDNNDAPMEIYLTQDGLCSIKEIMKYAPIREKDDEEELMLDCEMIAMDYELIRKGTFDLLVWPGYAVSINNLRKSKYKDRIDLMMIDLQKFFTIKGRRKILTKKLIKEIWEGCDLARAYIYPYTFYWLCTFNSFEDFCKQRNLHIFLETKDKKVKEWDGCGKGFTIEYYKKLIEKTKQYKLWKKE